jgi:alkylation response protein AidB-like acyl-CoA dehydrogenase
VEFTQTPDGIEAAGLATSILDKHCTPERLKEVEREPVRFDHDLWRRFADSGLISLTVPEKHNGSGMGLLELCSVLVETGRRVAPLPLGGHAVTAMALARFGTPTQQARWLPVAGLGEFVLTTALAEERLHAPLEPFTRADSDGATWLLTGSKVVVPAGPLADLFVVPAQTADGLTVFLVHADDPGVVVVPQQLSGGEVAARLELDRASVPMDRVLGQIGEGGEIVHWLVEHLTVALCARQLGVLEGALALTSEYAKTREQFGRPIGTFQAVSQRLADAYIDVMGVRLTLWQAAWRLAEGLPATREIATAKLWASDAGHRVAHTTVHVHGGVGIDLDGQAHRYFTAAKRNEFTFGGATEQARAIGRMLAQEPAGA